MTTDPEVAVFVAVDADGWAGMAAGRWLDHELAVVALWGMWVDPRSRRHGLGRRLADAVHDWARDQGAAWLRVGVIDGLRLQDFYGLLGFEASRNTKPLPRDESQLQPCFLARPVALAGAVQQQPAHRLGAQGGVGGLPSPWHDHDRALHQDVPLAGEGFGVAHAGPGGPGYLEEARGSRPDSRPHAWCSGWLGFGYSSSTLMNEQPSKSGRRNHSSNTSKMAAAAVGPDPGAAARISRPAASPSSTAPRVARGTPARGPVWRRSDGTWSVAPLRSAR